MQCLHWQKQTILRHLNQLTNDNKFKVKLNNIENKFPHSTIWKKKRLFEHSIFQCNVFIGKNRLCEQLTQILTFELMQGFKKGKNKLCYLLAFLYLASIFIQLTSIYFWCALFIVFLILFIIIKTLCTHKLEYKIYRNKMITAKNKKVTHASHSRTSCLQARLWETSNQKNTKTLRRKHRKLTHLLLWI